MSSEIEHWLEQNTGWCERFRLKVSPIKCKKWSAGQKNNWGATGISTYQEDCVGCPGPKMKEGIVPSPKFVPADKEKVASIVKEQIEKKQGQPNTQIDISDYPWLEAWLIEASEETGKTSAQIVVSVIAEQVPAEFIKQHILRSI